MHLRLLVLGLLLISSPALAQDEPDRNIDLMRHCQTESADFQVACLSYIRGMMDMHGIMSTKWGKSFYCLPKQGISGGQAVKIFVKWAEDHPERLHEFQFTGVILALAEAFPCN